MRESDVQLIHRTLSGDDAAFTTLVEKYRKSVHALAWRKVGDFHFAEEITQDVFLQVYKKLITLRNPNQFAGWLYVITNRLCHNWHRKNKTTVTQSLEATHRSEVDGFSYKCYESEQREIESAERRRETVKKLLQKLPESERTVVTLYYLGEMTAKEIGKFLGVSVNTIKSRLQRARKRLQVHNEELLVQETLGSVQLPANLTENIMRQVADLKPISPPVAKPFLPWAVIGATTLLVMMLVGISNQYLAQFQQPYSFEAQAEPTIEIIDALITLDLASKPAIRNQIGQAATPGKNNRTGLQVAEAAATSPVEADLPAKFSTAQWIQMNGPQGSQAFDIFVTADGSLYTHSPISVYKLAASATVWTPVNINIPLGKFRVPIAEHAGTLYIISGDELFTSTDNGETWNVLGTIPEGSISDLIVIDAAEGDNSHPRPAIYLAIWEKGIFRSTDAGKHWTLLNNGFADRKNYKLTAVGNTVFAGTDKGLYRLNSDAWEQLSVDTTRSVLALEVSGDDLYIGTGREVEMRMHFDDSRRGKIFRSTDLGESWTEITPRDERGRFMALTGISISVTGETILVRGVKLFSSTDGGRIWMDLGHEINYTTFVARDENTFYKTGIYGMHRTIDGGQSWHPFMEGMVGTNILDLVTLNDRLYVHTGKGIVESVDNGESWATVPIETSAYIASLLAKGLPNGNFYRHSKLVTAGDVLYGIAADDDNLRITHLPVNDNTLVPVEGVPAFDAEKLSPAVLREIGEAEGIYASDGREKEEGSAREVRITENDTRAGAFAISGDIFYVEYRRKLFKWQPGNPEWINTGLIDTGKRSDDGSKDGFKLAVSAETVYVGKRDGKLFQSFDGGNSWRDITSSLPLHFTQFKEIVFAGSTVYVATDRGVLVSETGAHWRVLTDDAGERIVIERFAVDDTDVYAAGNTGVYRLKTHGQSEQISPNVPDKVLSLVANNDRLYIATKHHGMFYIPLEKEG